MNAPKDTSLATLLGTYVALLGLLGVTALVARLPAGGWNLPLALAIAFAKLALIFYFFMCLRNSGGLVRVFAVAGFFWLGIMLTLMFADYTTRGWMM